MSVMATTSQEFCTRCGQKLVQGAASCPLCGAPGPTTQATKPGNVYGNRPQTRQNSIANLSRGLLVTIAVAVVALAVIVGIGVVKITGSNSTPAVYAQATASSNLVPTGITPSAADSTTTTAPIEDHPTLSTIAWYPAGAAALPAAEALNTYLEALNNGDLSAACAMNTANSCSELRSGSSNSTWSSVRISNVTARSSDLVAVTFSGQTNQPAADGPNNETCTIWNLTYGFTPSNSTWSLSKVLGGSSRPC